MSVAFHIPNAPDSPYIPIASEAFFNKYWAKKSALEGLDFISQFGLGVDVDVENLPDIISELEKLYDKIPSYNDVPINEKSEWLGRISNLITALKRFLDQEHFQGFIG